MILAKLSTAITVPFGPVLDSTGAEYTGLVVGEVKICKNNGTPAALNGSATLTHKEVGNYELVLTASDISAVGQATLICSKTTYVAPPVHLNILPAKVYDSLVGGTDNLEVDAVQVGGTNQTGRDLGASVLLSPGTGTGQISLTSGAVTAGTVSDKTGYALTSGERTSIAGAVWGALTSGLSVVGSVGAGIVQAFTDIGTLLSRLTSSRAGYLDNLNVGGNVASSAEVTAIQNNTRVVRVVPPVIERPDSAPDTYRVELLLYDDNGNMEAPDSAPTIALVNQGGTDRSSRLDSTTMALVETGRYRAIYTANPGDALEQLVWTFSVVEGGATRKYGNQSVIVDTTAVDFTAADRTKLEALETRLTATRAGYLDNLSAGAVATASALSTAAGNVASILGKFTGITALAQWLGAMAGKQTPDATALAEIRASGAGSGTYDPATDSPEAIRDRGDVAWITANGFSTLTQADVRAAIGMGSANLDTQLTALGVLITGLPDSVTDAVLDEALAGHATAGTVGAALAAASASGDPWSTVLPASYVAGTAGYIIGNISGGGGASADAVAGAIIAILTASSWSSVLTASSGSDRYSARVDVEQVFGATNVAKWADLDNDGDEEAIAQRIDAIIADADSEIDARLRGSIAKLPFVAPIDRVIKQLSARLAGIKLYEARGVQDFDEVAGAPQHRLTWHRREVERMLKDIRSGRVRLRGATYVATPQAVDDDE